MMTLVSVLVLLLAAGLAWWGGRRVMAWCEAASQADWGAAWMNRVDGLNRLFCVKYHRLSYEPVPLPAHGPALVVANHVSGLDPFLVAAACRRPLRFLIAREQYERFGLRWLFRAAGCIPVEREGRSDLAFREALKALRRGEVVALFPQGGIQNADAPPRRLKSGVVRLSYMTGSPIYPVRVEDIKGAGHIVRALARRSRARLHSFAPLSCDKEVSAACLERLREQLEGLRKSAHAARHEGWKP